MTPQELKNSILQLAIQGKLVEQRPEEGTAEELFVQIQKEKQKLIAEKKIKKEKPLPKITDDEKPFDIPKTWLWVRLGKISSLITKGTTPRGGNVSYLDKGIGFLRAENISGLDKLDKTNLKYIDENTHSGYLRRSIIQENDILITIAGTLGRTAIIRKEDLPLNANQAVSIVRLIDCNCVNLLYLIYSLNSGQIQKYLTKQKKTTAIPNLTLEIIENCIIPLPPLAEQKRIVAKIEELLPYVDRYEQAWSKLEQFNSRFPEDMKKSLLQYAIQGKLVEQRPEEGTAEELFAQIQKEKQKLIAEKKIKKEKPLPEITDDEKPFDIPESWKWCRLGSVLNKLTDGAHSTPKYTPVGIPFLSVKDMSSGMLDFSNCKYISEEEHQALYSRCNPEYEDLLLTKVGTTGIPVIVDTNQPFSLFVSVALLKFDKNLIYNKFLRLLINSPLVQTQAAENTKGVGNKNWVMRDIANTIIVLPPLAEQKRIVEKLEQLLPLCDHLKGK